MIQNYAIKQQKGVRFSAYLDQLALERGYLVIFDHGAVKSWRQEQVEVDGKSIFAVWV